MKRLVSLVGVLFMSFSVHAQQDALRPFVPRDAEIRVGTVLTGQLLVGPARPTSSAASPQPPPAS
jgi:hypothetical protein